MTEDEVWRKAVPVLRALAEEGRRIKAETEKKKEAA